jgi:16S rRNA (cytosine967-C5)-methyltransferase
MKQYGKNDSYRLMAAFKDEAPVTLRANSLKISRNDLIGRLKGEGHEGQPTAHSPFGVAMLKRAALTATESFQHGLFEVQDEASQLAAMTVDAKPGEVILDACAGAGGKALMMAVMMNDQGAIIAADIDERKLKELEKRALRADLAAITALPTGKLERMKKYCGTCDAVLLDVPCSGTGTLRRAPDLAARLTEDGVVHYTALQGELLHEYAAWLKPGGRLIYSTCSVLRAENEDVVEQFISETGFEPADAAFLKKAGVPDSCITAGGYFVALPCMSRMDGFFAAVIKKPR